MPHILKDRVQVGGEEVEIAIEVDAQAPTRAGSHQPRPTIVSEDLGADGGKSIDLWGPATSTFGKGLDLIKTQASLVAQTVESMGKTARPSEVEVRFGVKIVAEAGAVIARGSTQGHLDVLLKWKAGDLET